MSGASADVDENTLQEQADDNQLAVIARQLQDDQAHWDKHLQKLQEHGDAMQFFKENARPQRQ